MATTTIRIDPQTRDLLKSAKPRGISYSIFLAELLRLSTEPRGGLTMDDVREIIKVELIKAQLEQKRGQSA